VSASGTPESKVKVSRLIKRADFLRLSRGRRWSAPGLVLQMAPAPEPLDALRVGFTATKKLGGAVVRNRVKRRLREAASAVLPLLGQRSHDYVLVGREATAERPFEALIEDLKQALRKVHGARPPKAEER
jgi:ribonuclease P protein component